MPCPPGYPERGVICVERSVFDQIQSARATADSPRATPVAAAPAAPASAPTQTAGRYVQVGAFAVPSNAQNTIARLQSQGLPPVTRQARQRGRTLQLVLAGPFSSHAELRAALGTARAMGFSDAFIR
ncbi:MAG: SPOR domain-containing protein [Pararhodobacter sp.]|nr:SPOR domain-containing protein [Pararhodobacter sp.]